jgi:DNA-directed RNA polymerase subunit F
MAKMIFSKEETRNLIMMLQSEDADNHIIAFESLKNVDFKKYTGEILVLYKFGGHTLENWMINCKKIATKLLDIKPETPLSSPKTLSLITKHKGSKASVELFMEFFIRDMSRMLESIGYPTDKFEINIKFKDDGQTTES